MPDYQVALRSNRYPAESAKHETGVPAGQLLAEELGEELGERLDLPVEVRPRDPFWVIRLGHPPESMNVLVGLYSPHSDPIEAIWGISTFSRRRLVDDLLGRPESDDVVRLVKAIHEVLRDLPGVTGVRWFKRWPADPYKVGRFSSYPVFR